MLKKNKKGKECGFFFLNPARVLAVHIRFFPRVKRLMGSLCSESSAGSYLWVVAQKNLPGVPTDDRSNRLCGRIRYFVNSSWICFFFSIVDAALTTPPSSLPSLVIVIQQDIMKVLCATRLYLCRQKMFCAREVSGGGDRSFSTRLCLLQSFSYVTGPLKGWKSTYNIF